MDVPKSSTPGPSLPEMRLRAAGVLPPIGAPPPSEDRHARLVVTWADPPARHVGANKVALHLVGIAVDRDPGVAEVLDDQTAHGHAVGRDPEPGSRRTGVGAVEL